MNDTPITALQTPSDPQLKVRRPTLGEWLATALPGQRFTYCETFLADRITPPSAEEKAEGLAALEAYARGEVELAQKRIKPSVGNKPGAFQYFAIKKREIRKPTVLGSPWKTRIHGPVTAR